MEDKLEKIHQPEYDYILEEINRLFDIEYKNIKGKKPKKNLELTRIYLPEKDFRFLEKFRAFKKYHNLGGIPVIMIKEKKIRIDTEVVNPRKRKRKTVIYVYEEK